MDAPLNAAQAAAQLSEIFEALHKARVAAKKHKNCRDLMEHLYRKAKSLAALQVEGPNKETRDAQIHEWAVPPAIKAQAGEVAEAAGLGPEGPDTVGELRWLRDRAESLADSYSASAYDERAHLSGWQTVASMAKSEAELAPPERMPA